METAGGSETTRLVVAPLPLSQRIKYAILAFIWSKLLLKPMLYFSEAKKLFVAPGENEPDLVKTYPVRKSLTIRSVHESPLTNFPEQPATNHPPASSSRPATAPRPHHRKAPNSPPS